MYTYTYIYIYVLFLKADMTSVSANVMYVTICSTCKDERVNWVTSEGD